MSKSVIVAGILLVSFAVPLKAEYSADSYRTCSACHLADGSGIPGAFPSIRNRSARMAELDGGRSYLIAVVIYGLMGAIQVDGMQYFGVMPGNAGAMSAEEIAASLNYIVFELNDGSAELAPFTSNEVEELQASIALKSPAGGGALRAELAEQHGDKWP